MPCYHPLSCYQSKKGKKPNFNVEFPLKNNMYVPCNQCIGCRIDRTQAWAIRCECERQLHEDNCFITLTYNQEHLPNYETLIKTHFQKFIKRLRKKISPKSVRYYMCGEYGDKGSRPHYHAILFAYTFPDGVLYGVNHQGDNRYTSEILTKLWGKGRAEFGQATFQSSAYVARYILKKQLGKNARTAYQTLDETTGEVIDLQPEYTTMSLKPGIGAKWFEKYYNDVYPDDTVVISGKCLPTPSYFDRLYKRLNIGEYDLMKEQRIYNMQQHKEDNTPERLKQREQVKTAQLNKLKRHED